MQSPDASADARPPFVFVVGCPRSGTSPFARWLHASGLSTVSDTRRAARYPSGYYEHLPLALFHRGLERLPRGAEYRITLEPYLCSGLLEDPLLREGFERAFAPVIEREIDFLKHPQLALSIDFLRERFPDAHVVALWREPAATFRSLVTREFPVQMRPASGITSVLLWSVYAHHLVAARRRHPGSVTVVEIDGFLADPAAGAKLMERVGRPAQSAAPVAEAVDRALWGRPLPPAWRAYHRLMAWTCRAMRGRLGEAAGLADQSRWVEALREVSDLGGSGSGR